MKLLMCDVCGQIKNDDDIDNIIFYWQRTNSEMVKSNICKDCVDCLHELAALNRQELIDKQN